MRNVEQLQTELREHLHSLERSGVVGLSATFQPAEWAAIVPRLDPDELLTLFEWLPDDDAATVLATLDPHTAADVLQIIGPVQAAAALDEMPEDDAADVLEAMSDEQANALLTAIPAAEADELRDLGQFDPDTAGGIMSPGFIAMSPSLHADQAISALRKIAAERQPITYTYILDDSGRLLGVLSLHALVLAAPDKPVTDLMVQDVVRVRADTEATVAAQLLRTHRLLSLPVVSDDDRLLGLITPDDLANLALEEAIEDIERLGGSQPLETSYRSAPITLLVRRRLGWLMVLFLAEMYTSTVLKHYDGDIGRLPLLSIFIPLLTGVGGNVGSTTVGTLIRSMALGEVRLRDIRWVVFKEFGTAALMGLGMAVIAFGRAEWLGVGHDLALVVALSIVIICAWSATVAAVLPLVLRALHIDPALVSAPLITTLVDGTGLIIYFTIAEFIVLR